METTHLLVPRSLKNLSFSKGTSGKYAQKLPTKNCRQKAHEPAIMYAERTLPIYLRWNQLNSCKRVIIWIPAWKKVVVYSKSMNSRSSHSFASASVCPALDQIRGVSIIKKKAHITSQKIRIYFGSKVLSVILAKRPTASRYVFLLITS